MGVRWATFLLMAGLMAAPRPALAVDVFFNGVKITGLKNQNFPSCSVKFDKSGNIHVTAKGYSVQQMTQAEPGKPPAGKSATAKLSSRKSVKYQYFLVSTGQSAKASNWDVDVFINGKWVQKVRSAGDQVVLDVSRHLKVGKNQLMFAAVKNYAGKGRLSSSPAVHLRVLLGRGTRGGGTVSVEHTIADFRARADQTTNFSRSATIAIE
ncbi:MAG: hypothetical protein JRH20_08045 [Deltaproteobacteria bacterium]|nr:hypothetical protein [Deltaproteobacteria bacterium]